MQLLYYVPVTVLNVQYGEMPSQTHALGMTSVLDCMAVMMIIRAMVWMSYFECI